MTKQILCGLISTLLLAAPITQPAAAPVAEADRVDIDLRRTTLIVSDIENSLKFYRDALGFKVIYDNMIRTPRSAQSDAEADVSRRLVFVRANDDYIGIIGLLEYTKPRKPVRRPEPVDFSTGSAVLLFTTTDLATRFPKAAAVPGVKVLDPPTDTSYPSYDGSSILNVRVSTLRDPDGFLIELNEFIGENPVQPAD
ncbi:MAG: VOC family protein [Gammaproteobacteria bacterium]|nr:VOC family protein [Gammaproteobacteria bacterium]